MTAPIFIDGSLSGLGAERTEISYEQWVRQVDSAWMKANPDKVDTLRMTSLVPTALGLLGIVMGAVAYGTGSRTAGVVLGAAGIGAVVFGRGFSESAFGSKSILNVGSHPGIAGVPCATCWS